MTSRPFMIQCSDKEDTRLMLRYLSRCGYAADHRDLSDWADDYPDNHVICIHSEGHGVNTRRSVQAMHHEIPASLKATVFQSARHFLTSNRNVDMKGQPMAHQYV